MAKTIPLRKGQRLEDWALTRSTALIDRIRDVRTGLYKADRWKMVMKTLEDEGKFVRESSPAAVVAYAQYVFVAKGYLMTYPEPWRATQLLDQIGADMSGYKGHGELMERRCSHVKVLYEASEIALMATAKAKIREIVAFIEGNVC